MHIKNNYVAIQIAVVSLLQIYFLDLIISDMHGEIKEYGTCKLIATYFILDILIHANIVKS
jgi:hypothetical protein